MLTTVGTFTFAPATAWATTVEDVSYLDAAGSHRTADDVALLEGTAAIGVRDWVDAHQESTGFTG